MYYVLCDCMCKYLCAKYKCCNGKSFLPSLYYLNCYFTLIWTKDLFGCGYYIVQDFGNILLNCVICCELCVM